jgi:hypothetical protein
LFAPEAISRVETMRILRFSLGYFYCEPYQAVAITSSKERALGTRCRDWTRTTVRRAVWTLIPALPQSHVDDMWGRRAARARAST